MRELQDFPQDLQWFAAQMDENKPLLSPEQAAKQNERFHQLFFSAWSATKPGKGNLDFFRSELGRKGNKRGYAENLQPWNAERWTAMETNADLGHFPSLRQAAVTVQPTALRLAPTMRPRFTSLNTPGQGFPFDEFQQTSLPVGMPLMIFHRSRDGAWLYGENALVSGWIPAKDVAYGSEAFCDVWKKTSLAAFVRDDVPLTSAFGTYLSQASIGCVLPLRTASGAAKDDLTVLTPVRDSRGWAMSVEAKVRRTDVVPMPLPVTPGQISIIGNRLLGQAYGWGGLYGDRDCSGMLRDLFTPFGIWLPRNSASQAKAGECIRFGDMSTDAKTALIRKDGVPFLTLLWLRGHIGLYVGDYKRQAAFFHSPWGLQTKGGGRYLIGRAVISSTVPGQELPEIDSDKLLINRMQSMTILGAE